MSGQEGFQTFANMQGMSGQSQHHHQDVSLYTSSQAASSSSSLIDQASDHGSMSSHHGSSYRSSGSSTKTGPGPSSNSQGFSCPNCGKTFARDDLLRRHLAREARALAQPSFDRQKSCYECARSKARCDLEVPSCGRCRARGKQCVYAPRSGNPNIRKARTSGILPSGAAGGVVSAQGMGNGMVAGFSGPGQGWGLSTSLYELDGQNTGSMPGTPSFVKREGEVDYDSTSENESAHSWHDAPYAGPPFRAARTSSVSSAASSGVESPRSTYSLGDAPDSAPANITQFSIGTGLPQGFVPPVRTDSPSSYNDVQIGPSTASASVHDPTRRSSGFSRTNTGSIVTNVNRANANFDNEEGEETPIVRVTNSFAQATGLDPSRNVQQPPNTDYLSTPGSRQRTTSLPHNLDGATGSMGDSEMSDAWGADRAGAGGMAPPSANPVRTGSGSLMPPPLITPSQQQQPPTLITSNLPSRAVNPSPMRPTLFTNGLDLSGWLDEPVVPSPLYRMGPSMHSSLSGAFSGMSGGSLQSPVIETPISARFSASLAQLLGSTGLQQSSGTSNMQVGSAHTAVRYGADGQAILPAPQLPSAKQWWGSPDQSGEVKASIAQASAAHFVSYPALMVLTDPTSPIPPFIHRRWLQENRQTMPASLAIARSLLAGYYVRLAASEGLMWRLISEQIRALVSSRASLAADEEVFAATAALWMYLVLVIFTDDAACLQHVDGSLLDEGLGALSALAEMLSARLRNQGSEDTFLSFGRHETFVRTLYAAYALLVLQRFREGATANLAGRELVLDIPLPAGAAAFEAGTEADWRRHSVAKSGSGSGSVSVSVSGTRPTLSQLVNARNEKPTPPMWSQALFDDNDEFTNLVLSVAFALDSL